MREFAELFSHRKREVDKHLALVRDLQDAALNRARGGPVDIEHINILKSAFFVHLYNVIESVMAKVIDEVTQDLRNHQPHKWTDGVFVSWLKHRAALEVELGADERLEKVIRVIKEASGRENLASTQIARPEGNWSDKEVKKIADSLLCDLVVRPEVQQRACVVHFVDNKPPIRYVRHMRNQLSHGNLSFMDAAALLSVDQLQQLQNAVVDFMEDVVSSFSEYLDEGRFLKAPAA